MTLSAMFRSGFVIIVVVIAMSLGTARADQVHSLSRTLVHSKNAKARIAAAVSLGRMNDSRALKALVHGLRDESRVVRAVAATALGHLGDGSALPALQQATRDKDSLVRKRATEALASIRNKVRSRTRVAAPTPAPTRSSGAGFGKQATRIGPEPTIFVAVRSAADESKEPATVKERKSRANSMRGYMLAELRARQDVTMSHGEAEALALAHNSIDLSITKLDRVERGRYIEIECEIRIAISNERGKMLSFLTGGAKVQVPRVGFRAQYLPQLRQEAIENAVKSVHQDLLSYLRRAKSPS
ncbi:MAG TPA: HEAT repeat domain-containing protein [Kofleriaceae bacterium]|nr:HEAT repeat domain-containing protein [Kofleriaceae bacterium]